MFLQRDQHHSQAQADSRYYRHMQTKRLVSASVIALMALLALASTPKGMAPLPVRYLSGRTFHSPDGWFQVEVPAGWEWFEMRAFDGQADPRWPDAVNQTVAWMAQDPKTFDNVVVMETYRPGGDVITGAFVRDFETQTHKAVEPDTMAELSTSLVTISGEKSFRYRYKLVRKTGTPLYRFGYVTGMDHKVYVSTSDKSPNEPQWFTQTALSLHWVKMP